MHLRASRCVIAVVLLATLLPAGAAVAGIKAAVPGVDDVNIEARLLLQPWYQMTAPFATTAATTNDFFLRRARVVLSGQITKWVSFFFDTDNANWGKGGWGTSDFFVQDAVISFDLHPSFHLMAGMILPPFVRHGFQSAATLNTLEYHTNLIKYPTGSNKVWRDVGVGIRGLIAKKLDYRLSITNGAPDAGWADEKLGVKYSTKGIPRITGRVTYNFFDAEDGLFTGGTYLGKKKFFSIGVAGDVQPRAYGKTLRRDAAGNYSWGDMNSYYAVGGDVFWDLPMGGNRLSGQLDVAYYGGVSHPGKGIVIAFDASYGIGKWAPVVSFDWYKKSDVVATAALSEFEIGQFVGIHGGLNYFWRGHEIAIKLDVGVIKDLNTKFGDSRLEVTLQPQFLF